MLNMGFGEGLKSMTVSELIEELSQYEGHRTVLFENVQETLESIVRSEQLRSGAIILS